MLIDTNLPKSHPISCKNARTEANVFETVSIDLQRRSLHVDNKITFNFMECGIAGPDINGESTFGAVPVAFSAATPLVGTHPA